MNFLKEKIKKVQIQEDFKHKLIKFKCEIKTRWQKARRMRTEFKGQYNLPWFVNYNTHKEQNGNKTKQLREFTPATKLIYAT